MSEKLLELGSGLEIWKCAPSEIREQDLNARSMPKEMFDRLTSTIARDKRLESLPFCAVTQRGIEVVSGHHRLRAALNSQMAELFVVVDVSGLSPDQIAAKQLAHNSIQGEDEPSLVKQIYDAIKDAEARLEAFVDISADALPQVKTHDIDLALDYQPILLLFLPAAREQFDKIAQRLDKNVKGVYVADLERFESFKKTVNRISAEYDIRSIATAISRMCDMVQQSLGDPLPEPERVAIRDLFKSAYISKDAADRVRRFLAQKKNQKGEPWQNVDALISMALGPPATQAPARTAPLLGRRRKAGRKR